MTEEFTYPLRIDTLGKVKAIGYSISIDCHTCHRHVMLDTDRLIERLGADHSSRDRDLRPHFFCKDCRDAGRPDRNFGFTLHHGHNAYEKAKGV